LLRCGTKSIDQTNQMLILAKCGWTSVAVEAPKADEKRIEHMRQALGE
jgi:hypothetical protein